MGFYLLLKLNYFESFTKIFKCVSIQTSVLQPLKGPHPQKRKKRKEKNYLSKTKH